MKDEFEEQIVITWWLNDDIPVSMVFNYEELIKNWIEEINKYIGIYEKEYLMEHDN